MASTSEQFSAPGTAYYESNTMTVGDGTWDFTKNTFLLPNLMGLNYETTRYNGMGNRFSTVKEYHVIVTAHGVLAAIVFLALVPGAVFHVRFSRDPAAARVAHSWIQTLAVLIITVVFTLGWFAVGPERSWTNPHHVIGLVIYVLFLLQGLGGRLIKKLAGRSLRLMIHRWSGRCLALLGFAQIPLGLALYGAPKSLYILYAVWMAFLFVLYFIFCWLRDGRRFDSHGATTVVHHDHDSEHSEKKGHGWLGPLAAGAGIWALMHRRNKKKEERARSRSRSASRSRLGPEVLPSRRGSSSYMDSEKYSDRTDHRGGGGIMGKLLGVAGALGAGAAVKTLMDRREKRKYGDEEYSAVATETPSRPSRPMGSSHRSRPRFEPYTETDFTTDFTDDRTNLRGDGRRTPLLGEANPAAAAAALSAAESRPNRPSTPAASRPPPRFGGTESMMYSDYSSYVTSPPRKPATPQSSGVAKGFLGALGLGWLGKKVKDRKDQRAEDERLRMEEEKRFEDERRQGRHGSRFTGDGYGSPSKKSRRPQRPPTASSYTETETGTSLIDARPPRSGVSGPPMPPYGAATTTASMTALSQRPTTPPTAPPLPVTVPPASGGHSRSHSRVDVTAPVSMPSMPPDPAGILAPLGPPSTMPSAMTSARGTSRQRSTRRRSHSRSQSRDHSKGVSVKVKYHDDRDRNVTLRRLTDEERAAARGGRRGRSDSVSSISGAETPTRRRYRRDSSSRRSAEEGAERLVPLSPPTPAYAGSRKQKDSAYYSGQPGPSGLNPMAGQTLSSIGDTSGISGSPSGPAGGTTTGGSAAPSAADRRRRRRMERGSLNHGRSGTVDFS